VTTDIFQEVRAFMPKGKVKFYDIHKSYGFISPDDAKAGDKDVFVHFRELQESGLDFLGEHQKVSYEVKEVKGKRIACQIKLLEP
jgi:CspA family cold shock protein